MLRKLLLLANPCAGRRQAERYLPEIRAVLENAGFDLEIYETQERGDATRMLSQRAGAYDRVVCVGGDGTLNEVITGVLASGCRLPVGYIPAGSTNDLAASLRLSGNILKAARDAVKGDVIKLDVGGFNDRKFVYTASFGAFTRASYAAPQRVKNVLGHLAYLIEGVRDMAGIRPLHVRFEMEGASFEDDYVFGAISNSTSMGGILKIDPSRVDLTDGKFELLLVRATSNIAQLVSAAAALRACKYDHEFLRLYSVSHLKIFADPDMPWTLDGEFQPGAEEIFVQNLHGAIDLIVPS